MSPPPDQKREGTEAYGALLKDVLEGPGAKLYEEISEYGARTREYRIAVLQGFVAREVASAVAERDAENARLEESWKFAENQYNERLSVLAAKLTTAEQQLAQARAGCETLTNGFIASEKDVVGANDRVTALEAQLRASETASEQHAADAAKLAEQLREATQWRGMESAPRDGTDVLLDVNERPQIGWYSVDKRGWRVGSLPCSPIGWSALPPPRGAEGLTCTTPIHALAGTRKRAARLLGDNRSAPAKPSSHPSTLSTTSETRNELPRRT